MENGLPLLDIPVQGQGEELRSPTENSMLKLGFVLNENV